NGEQAPSQVELRTEAVAALLFNDARQMHQFRGMFYAVSPDAKRAVSLWATEDKGGLQLSDLETGKELGSWEGEQLARIGLAGFVFALGPQGKVLASLDGEKFQTIALTELPGGKQRRKLQMPPLEERPQPAFVIPGNLVFSSDGRWLAAARVTDSGNQIVLWDLD